MSGAIGWALRSGAGGAGLQGGLGRFPGALARFPGQVGQEAIVNSGQGCKLPPLSGCGHSLQGWQGSCSGTKLSRIEHHARWLNKATILALQMGSAAGQGSGEWAGPALSHGRGAVKRPPCPGGEAQPAARLTAHGLSSQIRKVCALPRALVRLGHRPGSAGEQSRRSGFSLGTSTRRQGVCGGPHAGGRASTLGCWRPPAPGPAAVLASDRSHEVRVRAPSTPSAVCVHLWGAGGASSSPSCPRTSTVVSCPCRVTWSCEGDLSWG